jgi:hypothetical protein
LCVIKYIEGGGNLLFRLNPITIYLHFFDERLFEDFEWDQK